MPNHIHGILWINHGDDAVNRTGVARTRRDVACNVSTTTETTTTKTGKNKQMSKISPKYGSLATVIRSFKSAVTKKSREILPYFAWQPRFYDRIIRNEKEMNRISEYIILNPERWERDRNNNDLLDL